MDFLSRNNQVMGQSPFSYHNPDPKPDNRQHGHFSQQPSNIQMPVYHPHMQSDMQSMPSAPIYSRPNSSLSQPPTTKVSATNPSIDPDLSSKGLLDLSSNQRDPHYPLASTTAAGLSSPTPVDMTSGTIDERRDTSLDYHGDEQPPPWNQSRIFDQWNTTFGFGRAPAQSTYAPQETRFPENSIMVPVEKQTQLQQELHDWWTDDPFLETEAQAAIWNWREIEKARGFAVNDGLPNMGRQMGSTSPTGTYLEVLSLPSSSSDNGWATVDSLANYDVFQQAQNAAIFNPGQTLHLRTHSDFLQSDGTGHSLDNLGSFEEISYPPYSPYSPDTDNDLDLDPYPMTSASSENIEYPHSPSSPKSHNYLDPVGVRPVEPAKGSRYSSTTRTLASMIPQRKNRRKILRILLKGKEQIACPDSGSMQNIMSETFAIENNLVISRKPLDRKPFELGSGTRVYSIGRVRTTVELLGKTLRRKQRTFYVFATCPVPLILGMPFLNEAEILTKNRYMLEMCPLEISTVPSLLWIGSPRRKRRSHCNRMKCTLDGRKLVAIADTGADLNFMCPECAEREGFSVDTRVEARRTIQFGDGTEAETTGEVYIHNLSLDWREPITEAPEPATSSAEPSLPQENEESISGGTVFHVLPGLPCDVIIGQDVLDETDAFNRCSELSCTKSSRNKNSFELNIMIFKRKRKAPNAPLELTKEVHDNDRHAEMFRRSKREDEISHLPEDQRERAKARERIKSREWDAAHANCTYCNIV